jgi:GntR family transcriptional repressor for pyruvate dehydrogenase complex
MTESVWTEGFALERGPKLSDRVTSEVLEMISSRRLRPGDRLPSEQQIGELFGVSRTVVREALRSLAAKGVLDVRNGSGARVARVGTEQASEAVRLFVQTSANAAGGVSYEQIDDVRELIETHVTHAAAAAASAEDLAELRSVHQSLVSSHGDLDKAAELDVAFHRKIAAITGNPLYLVMLDSIEPTLLEIRRVTLGVQQRFERGVEAHEKILNLIAEHQPEAAEEAMREHLRDSRDVWRSMGGGRP